MSTYNVDDDHDDYLESQEREVNEQERETNDSLREKYPETFEFKLIAGDLVREAMRTVESGLLSVIRVAAVDEIRGYVKKHASGFVDQILRERLNEIVTILIAEGFQEVTSWGEPKGELKTLKQLVHEELHRERKSSSGYDKKPSILKETITLQVAATTKELVKEDMPELKARLKTGLEESWAQAVVSMLKSKFKI